MTQALVEAEISAGNKEQTTNVLYQWMRSLLRYSDKTEAPLCCSALCLHRTELVSEMKSWNQLTWGAVKASRIKALVRHLRNQLWLSQHQGLLRRSWHKGAPAFPAVQAPLKHTLAQQQKYDISVHLDRPRCILGNFFFFWELYFRALFSSRTSRTQKMETTKAVLAWEKGRLNCVSTENSPSKKGFQRRMPAII